MGKKTSITATGVKRVLASMKNDPLRTFNITNAVPNAQMHGNTLFRSCRWNAGVPLKPIDGMFIGRDIHLNNDVADPKNKATEGRAKWESTRLQLESTVSKAGETGEFILMVTDRFVGDVEVRLASGELVPIQGNRTMNIPVTKSYENKKTGVVTVYDDPLIHWKLDFGNYPDKFPVESMRGTPVTQFFDADKPKPGDVEDYELMTFEGAPITAANVHNVVTPDSIIKRLHFSIDTVAISDKGISLKCIANKVVLKVIRKEGIADDEGDDDVPLTGKPVPPVKPSSPKLAASSSDGSNTSDAGTSTADATAPGAAADTSTSTADAMAPSAEATTTAATTTAATTTAATTADLDATLSALLGATS